MIDALVAWFEENQRPLPWREDYDPYHVWISEVMLQQTQVETVLPYFERFITKFPTLKSLASAREEEVLQLWAGLGYYRRARNLLSAIRTVADKYEGRIPADYDKLIELPGVGPYMAGAILSIAFNKPFPIVDGNVRRVLSRLNGWTDDNAKAQWDAATKLVSAGTPRSINQSLMELGATVCSFRSPRCLLCPVQKYCLAFKTGMQEQIPPVKKRPATVHLHLFALVQKRGGRYLMKPAEGMWEFPMFSELPPGDWTRIGTCRHTITHHRMDISVYAGTFENSGELEWKVLSAVAVSSLTRKIAEVSGNHRTLVVTT